jgi:hypothetical protein
MGKRQIVEGGCEETFLCLIQAKEKCTFTVPPAVALMNYISSGLLWWIFCQTGTFRGVFSILSGIRGFTRGPNVSPALE